MITFTHTRITICRRYRQFRLIVWLCMCFFWLASASVASAQTYTYQKSLGKSGKQMKNPIGGYSMQAAHEDWNVIYCDSGTIALHRNGRAFFTYARWYNYVTDGVMTGLKCSQANYSTSNGLIWSATIQLDYDKADATYYYNGTDTVYIACDQSSYLDGGLNGTVFKEPTIEQRMIFEIRPASKMADSVNACTDTKWLETYDIIAPTNQTIHLGPKYAFMETEGEFLYPSYYYPDGTNTKNMGSSSFSTGGSTTIGKWEQQKATKDDTVYVCTEAHTGSATDSETKTNTWDLAVSDFDAGKQINKYTKTGSHTNNDTKNKPNNSLTWNYTRTLFDTKNGQFVNPAPDDNAVKFGAGAQKSYKCAENVVFSTKLPQNANVVSVKVSCYSSKNKGDSLSIVYKGNNKDSIALTNNNIFNSKKLYTYSSSASTFSVDSIVIAFTAKSQATLYVDQIEVTYTIPGQAAINFPKDTTITDEPADKSKWKRVVKTVSHSTWTKKDSVSAGGTGWMWLKDGKNLGTPSVSSGQYIKETAPTSPSTSTYQLMYSTGSPKTKTVYTNDTTITTDSIYTYSTKGWVFQSDSTNIEIINDTAVKTFGTGKIYNIAQFRVQYLDKNVVGPRAAEMSSFINNMELIAEQDFNYGYSTQNPLPSGVTQRFIPLPVEESTYGFYYGTEHRLPGSSLQNCYYNEYSFVSNGNGWKPNPAMANHVGQGLATDATTGFALYADGSQKAGTVFTLDFGADFCPGAKMFFTAWIGDQNKGSYNDGHPIFTFYVEGIDAEGNAHTLATFTTGEFKQEKDNWHHIIFPLEFSENVDYERFKLRIVNMAATVTNNDFFIDDIRVFLQRASVAPIQASTPKNVCLNEQDKMVLYTRIDYKELEQFLPGTSRNFYYRWFDMDGNAITDTTYLNCQKSQQDNLPYGYVTVPTNMSNNQNIVSSFDQFDEIHHNSDTAVYAFIEEECLNPDYKTEKRYVAYIATPVPVLFGQNYRCVVTYSPSDLPDTADVIDVNKKCQENAIVKTVNGLCIYSTQLGGFMADNSQSSANISYRLALVSEGMVRNGALSSKEVTYYYAHWLYGREPDANDPDKLKKDSALTALYGAPYQTVKRAIQAYIQNVTLGKADTLCTDEQKDLVDRLVQARLLKLSDIQSMSDTSYIVYPLLTVDSINYTAFPIQSIYGEESACKEPKAITLRFPKKEESGGEEGGSTTPTERNAIYFVGDPNETTPPDFVLSQPRRFRIPENTSSQVVNIALTNSESTYILEQAVLFETNNGNIDIKTPPFNRLNWLADADAGKEVTGTGNTVTFNNLNDLPEGYSYTFRMDYMVKDQSNEGVTHSYNGEAYITFIVVPDTLYYAGATGDAWNADVKWQRRNEKGEMVTAVAPLASTKVIYPQGNHVVMKPSSDKQQLTQLESNAQAFISYDINYAPYSCSEVYLPAQTAVVGQQYLKHNAEVPRWTIELPVWANKWKMNAIPLQAVVLGDIFVPAKGETDDNPFAVSDISQTVDDPAIDRTTYSFYNSLYNSDVRQYNENGGYANISSSTWSFATNELDKQVPAGYGWALGYAGTNTNTTIRLPKPNTKYNYFKDGVWVTFSSSDIDRKNAGKPMFTPDSEGNMSIKLTNKENSEIFLFGNPTFAYIDLKKLMKAYAYNDAVATDSIKIAGFYTAGVDKDSRYQLAAKTGGAEGWVSSVKSAGSVSDTSALLAPTEAVFIRFENAKNPSVVPSLTKVTLTLSTSMLCDKDGKYYGDGTDGTVVQPSSQAPAAQPEQALYITASRAGFMSSAVIVEDTTVEAEIFMLDKAKTPFAIFTVGNNRALAINHPRGEEHIPLALYAAAEVEQPTITFDGDPSYVMKWDLIDVKTGLREPLLAGRSMTLDLPLNGEVRYYLERTQRESVILGDTTEAFRLFAYCGQLIIYSEEPLYDLRVYDPTGRLIAASADAGNSFAIVLPAGTYIVRASGSTAKVIVH
ncbi:MAG: hypothetical protein ACI4AW_03180 [Paludibacteraceae bacterium]